VRSRFLFVGAVAGLLLGLLIPGAGTLSATPPQDGAVAVAGTDSWIGALHNGTLSVGVPARSGDTDSVREQQDAIPVPLLPDWVADWDPDERDITLTEWFELLFVVAELFDRTSPFDWRAHTSIDVRCIEPCPPAFVQLLVDGRSRTTFAPDAFTRGEEYLLALAAHELAHVWQFAVGHDSTSVLGGIGPEYFGFPDDELEADCLAAHWGWPARPYESYWNCPADQQAAAGAAYEANPLP
jgi:hypothetical protein